MTDAVVDASLGPGFYLRTQIAHTLGVIDPSVIQVAIAVLGVLLFLVFLVVLGVQLWLAFGDVLVILRNYNYPAAERCHWSSCGFFHHDEADPKSAVCMTPFVRTRFFAKRRRGGNQPGCYRSVQVRELEKDRRPADHYYEEFMSRRSAFQTPKVLWRLVTIGGGLAFWALGAIGLNDFIRAFF
jgi:hypothetical protein